MNIKIHREEYYEVVWFRRSESAFKVDERRMPVSLCD